MVGSKGVHSGFFAGIRTAGFSWDEMAVSVSCRPVTERWMKRTHRGDGFLQNFYPLFT